MRAWGSRAGLGLHTQGIRSEHIASIEIFMGHVNWLTVGEPYEPKRNEIEREPNAAAAIVAAFPAACG
jgi:hypothetical protein